MRAMTYRIELDAENGYVISNTNEASWESLPCRESFSHPPIKVSNAPMESGRVVGNIDDYAEPDWDGSDSDFLKNYLKALHGESDDWRLVAVSIDRDGATLLFGNEETGSIEFLHIRHTHHLRVWFDVYRESGSFDRYLFTMWEEAHGEKTYRRVRVTEYTPSGRREIVFIRGNDCDAECPDPHWRYAYVTEYR